MAQSNYNSQNFNNSKNKITKLSFSLQMLFLNSNSKQNFDNRRLKPHKLFIKNTFKFYFLFILIVLCSYLFHVVNGLCQLNNKITYQVRFCTFLKDLNFKKDFKA
jgi:hypothetical protein